MMTPLDYDELTVFVNQEIVSFHNARLARLEKIKLIDIIKRKNPYLFKAKDIQSAQALVKSILSAFLSSSEEELFGQFLESLAIQVASQTCNGRKSSAEGIDLEFDDDDVHYLVSIKSGPNWGNSSQKKRLADNFKTAVRVQKQGYSRRNIEPVLGICYGKTKTTHTGLYTKIVGQSFWHFISDDPDLYIKIIEPIGHLAGEHNANFDEKRLALEAQFIADMTDRFCHPDGTIDWKKLVNFNSGNL